MEELEVDWDHIDGEYREEPPIPTAFVEDMRNPTSTVVSAIQVPSSLVEKPNQPFNFSPTLVADKSLIKPDVYDDLRMRTMSNNNNNNRSIDSLL